MEKRYQVFVSSTFKDLETERSQVIQALLELDCIPSGMELFPAADEDQWAYIQQIIDDCDYYVVVLAGKYGSISEATGKSYTRMEYEYAIEKGKPVIGFLHGDLPSLPVDRSETDPKRRALLEEFQGLVKAKLCKHWTNADQLGGLVSRSMVQLMKRSPAVGWVRADRVTDESSAQEIARLRRQIEELEERLKKSQPAIPAGLGFDVDDLAQGKDLFGLSFRFTQVEEGENGYDHIIKDGSFKISWNEIFNNVSIVLSSRNSELNVRNNLSDLIIKKVPKLRSDDYIVDIIISEESFQSIKVQFRLLDLIEVIEPDSQSAKTDWRLTPKGELLLLQNRAVIRKNSN